MKYFYLILFTIILAGCGNSNFNQYQSQFSVNNPNSIHPDSIDIQSLNSITDMDLLKQLMSPFYSNPEDLDLVLKYQQFYFYSWMGEQQGMNKFTILQTEGEYPCIKNFYMFLTKEGKILDKKSIASDACLEMGIDRSNFQNVNDSTFNINYYIHDYQSFLPTPYVEECTIAADGKIACIKRDLSVGMCNWDKLSVRATPSDKGKYLTSINLGEKINVLGKFQVDEESDKKNEYALVSLSDNSQGWVQRRFIGENAYPAAITKETYIYKRADPLTRTNDKFYEFDVVAIGERDDSAEWYKVKGKPRGGNWFKTGWIKAEYFSTSDLNVAYSAMVSKSMVDDNYDGLMNIAMNKEFDITDLSLRKSLFDYLDIENVREYSGDEIESAEESISAVM